MEKCEVPNLVPAGKPVINSWCGIPSSFSAEVMAHAGWDSLVVDMQHGMIDYQMMVTMLQGISTSARRRVAEALTNCAENLERL